MYALPAADLRKALRRVGVTEDTLQENYHDEELVHKQRLLRVALPYVGIAPNVDIAAEHLQAMVHSHERARPPCQYHASIGTKAPPELLRGLTFAYNGDAHLAFPMWQKMVKWEEEMADKIKVLISLLNSHHLQACTFHV